MKDWTLGVRNWRYVSFETGEWSRRGWRTIAAWLDTIIAAGITLAAFLLYLRTLLPGLGSRDTAELQWVAPTLGLAHPTGYPLYTLLGWLWNQLPLGGLSAPMPSRFGVHLIQVLERRSIVLDTKQQREQARNVLREQKFDSAYNEWARDLRARAYIEMREPPQQ